jgi:hypothetical protein
LRQPLADKPRAADYRMDVLLRLLWYGVDPLDIIAIERAGPKTAPRRP